MNRKLICGTLSVLLLAGSVFADLKPIKEIFEPTGNYPADRYGKVAVVQWAPPGFAPLSQDLQVVERWKQQNRQTLEGYIREAASNGAEWVITPEFGIVGYPDIPGVPDEDDNFQTEEQIAPYAESIPGKSTQFFGALAKELNIYLHFGMAEKGNGVFHNTVVVMNPQGKVEASYRKIHLYQQEDDYLEAGSSITTYTGPFGKVGIIICSDVYGNFPMDDYLAAGVDVLTLSTSWAQWNTGMSNFQQGARWVNAYLLAANQNYFPDSGVINPNGSLQSHIRQTTGIAYGYLTRKK